MSRSQKSAENVSVGRAGGPRWSLSDDAIELVVAMLRVIADATRIRLLLVLDEQGSATVSALAARLGVTQQGMSKQLGVLYQAGVVSRRREGAWVRYELIDWTGLWLVEQLAAGLDDSASR